MRERNKKKSQKAKVYVCRNYPPKCRYCNGTLEKHTFHLNSNGNMKDPTGMECAYCHTLYLVANTYRKRRKHFEAINPLEAEHLVREIDENRAKKHEQKMKKREEEAFQKQKMLDLIDENIKKQRIKEVPEWKNTLKSSSNKVVSTLTFAVLVQREFGKQQWYFVMDEGRKNNQITMTVAIIGPDCIMGRALLECMKENKKWFTMVGTQYKIENFIVLNQSAADRLLKKSQDKQMVDTKRNDQVGTQNKKVYVYFRLNNRCVNAHHNIETVTAKTVNVKTGAAVEVNVFHCLECNRYFINHDALQNYTSRGVYPALNFELMDGDVGKLREASELMIYGYNVREGELSESERHKILSWIIDAGLMTKAEIIKDLQFKVNYNGKKSGNENAKKKWQSDIQFVSRYVKGNTSRIHAVFER